MFDNAITSRFRGYRKSRAWLTVAAIQARQDVSAVLAPILDAYEDDDDLRVVIDLVIARYPIKQRLAGIPRVDVTIWASGKQLETEAALILSQEGFAVEQIGGVGDQGADIIAKINGISFAIQCKDFAVPAGNAAVQQALSAKAFYQADYAVVCARNGFTKSAKSLAATATVILVPLTLLANLYTLRLMVD